MMEILPRMVPTANTHTQNGSRAAKLHWCSWHISFYLSISTSEQQHVPGKGNSLHPRLQVTLSRLFTPL